MKSEEVLSPNKSAQVVFEGRVSIFRVTIPNAGSEGLGYYRRLNGSVKSTAVRAQIELKG